MSKYHVARCESCYRTFPRSELRRKLFPLAWQDGSNSLLYSRWSTSFWSCDAVDKGAISMGVFPLEYEPILTPTATGYSNSETRGSQTWSGSGTIYSTTAVDISSFTNVLVSGSFGKYHVNHNPANMTVDAGFCDSGCVTKYSQVERSWNGGSKRVWWSISASEAPLSSTYIYFDITLAEDTDYDNSDYWWCDHFLLTDATNPTRVMYQPVTSGVAISKKSSDTHGYHLMIVCPSCHELIIDKPSLRASEFRFPEWVEILDDIEEL